MLSPHVSGNGAPHRCVDSRGVDLHAALRGQLSGSNLAIIGIGGDEAQVARAAQTLRAVARRQMCVIVLAHDADGPLVRSFETVSAPEVGFTVSRVAAAILLGKEPYKFLGFGMLFPKTREMLVGGLGWSDTTCARIAKHIRSVIERKSVT